jgi:hypothetical protein
MNRKRAGDRLEEAKRYPPAAAEGQRARRPVNSLSYEQKASGRQTGRGESIPTCNGGGAASLLVETCVARFGRRSGGPFLPVVRRCLTPPDSGTLGVGTIPAARRRACSSFRWLTSQSDFIMPEVVFFFQPRLAANSLEAVHSIALHSSGSHLDHATLSSFPNRPRYSRTS